MGLLTALNPSKPAIPKVAHLLIFFIIPGCSSEKSLIKDIAGFTTLSIVPRMISPVVFNPSAIPGPNASPAAFAVGISSSTK